MFISSLIQNAAVLVAVAGLYGLVSWLRPGGRGWSAQLTAGLLFGFGAVVGMFFAFEHEPGIIYDGRSAILAAGGVFTGGVGSIVAVVVAGTYRALLGGPGLWAGLATIVACTGVGLAFRTMSRKPPAQWSAWRFLSLGVVAHAVMLACQLLLPWDQAPALISRIWLPIMLILPPATVFIGLLLRTEERRIRTVEELREVRERFNQIADELTAAVWSGPPDGRTMSEATTAFETISGVPLDQLRADPEAWWRTVHPNDRAVVERAREELRREGRAHVEYRILRLGGETRWVRDNRSIIYDSRGKAVAMGGILTDITEVKEIALEREMLRVQTLQSQKLEAIGRLAGGVAHDFNNLLTVINNYADIAAADPSVGEELRKDIRQIATAGRRGAELTQQLLSFSRLQPAAPKTVSLNTLVSEMKTMLSRLIGETITFNTHLAEDLWTIEADPGRIHQVLMNLIMNARDAMPEGGTLVVATGNRRFDAGDETRPVQVPPGEWVSLAVSDTGGGLSEDIRSLIFEPFFTTKWAAGGSGLGLSTVHGLVTGSGGYIDVSSEPGVETTFTVFFPRSTAVMDAPPAEPDGAAKAQGETILVVEDEQAVRELIARILMDTGYRVLVAKDGVEALQMVADHPGKLHLVLTDLVMPRMDGRTLAGLLNVERPGTRVLFMSGYSEDSETGRERPSDGLDFIPKPFDRTLLLRTIRAYLDDS